MSTIQHTLVNTGEQEFLTVVIDGQLMPPVNDDHPNFDLIKSVVTGGPIMAADALRDLFDISETVAKRFEKLSERVTVQSGVLFFDGDPLDSSVAETVIRFLDEGLDDWQPLVNYIEKIQSNPEPHSREQLFDWLKLHDTISITPEGDLIAYKGVERGGKHPETGEDCFQSLHSGTAIVDGKEITGKIPNYVGAEVTMSRSAVAHDPYTACHTGLHVGTHPYARAYASGAMLAVRVNPRDVVSVPTDASGEKIRVCRYKVEKIVEEQYTGVLVDEFTEKCPPTPYFAVGDRVKDRFGRKGTVVVAWNGTDYNVNLDEPRGMARMDVNHPTGGETEDYRFAPWSKIEGPETDIEFDDVAEADSIQIGDVIRQSENRFIGTVVSLPGQPYAPLLKTDLSADDLRNQLVCARSVDSPYFDVAPYFMADKQYSFAPEVLSKAESTDEFPWYVGSVLEDHDGDKLQVVSKAAHEMVKVRYADPAYAHVTFIGSTGSYSRVG